MKKSLFLLPFITFCLQLTAQSTLVTTQNGMVEGAVNNGIYSFLGIPFAKPPVGNLRWRAPENPDAWNGVLSTTAYKPVCPQKSFEQGDTTGVFKGDEDCLYLNVWTPNPASTANLPVMVFIHGGGNQQGGASQTAAATQFFDGKHIAEKGPAVVVTIQYRLGPLGFLVHPGLEPENANNKSGNYALMDQILALHWVQENIAAFGGDPTKVMVFGESAGGVDVGDLMLSPPAAGLFQRACIESAVPVVDAYFLSKNTGITYVNSYIPTGTDVEKIAYMRTLDPDSLVKDLVSPLSGGVVSSDWSPVIDGVYHTGFPQQVIQSGNYNKVPLIIGSNADEMSISSPAVVTPLMVNLLFNTYVPAQYIPQGLTLYPPGITSAQARTSYVQALTDAQFTATTRRVARWVSDNQTEPVWRYLFSHHMGGPFAPYGAYHGIELFFVFNTWKDSPWAIGPLYTVQDDSVQNNTLRYWANFAATGNPNGANLVSWPQYHSATDCYLDIKPTPNGSLCGLRTEECNYWDLVSGFPVATEDLVSGALALEVSPNPGLSFVNINCPNEGVLMVWDMTGRILNQVEAKEGAYPLDISGYTSGMYLVVLQTASGPYVARLVKGQ